MQITVSQALQDCDAVLLYDKEYENLSFDGAAYDNRLVQKNNLFVCIKGENNDGHNFAKDAVARGASAVLAEKKSLWRKSARAGAFGRKQRESIRFARLQGKASFRGG